MQKSRLDIQALHHHYEEPHFQTCIDIDKGIAKDTDRFMNQPVKVAIDDYFDFDDFQGEVQNLDPEQLRILNIYQEKMLDSWKEPGPEYAGGKWDPNDPRKKMTPLLEPIEMHQAIPEHYIYRDDNISRKKAVDITDINDVQKLLSKNNNTALKTMAAKNEQKLTNLKDMLKVEKEKTDRQNKQFQDKVLTMMSAFQEQAEDIDDLTKKNNKNLKFEGIPDNTAIKNVLKKLSRHPKRGKRVGKTKKRKKSAKTKKKTTRQKLKSAMSKLKLPTRHSKYIKRQQQEISARHKQVYGQGDHKHEQDLISDPNKIIDLTTG